MDQIVEAADKFVFQLFKDKLPNTFVYHNYTHSKRVYKSINEIIEHSQIDVKDATVLRLAALLHDTGYTVSLENHEQESAKIARNFLESQSVDEAVIAKVEACILATDFRNKTPETTLEKIIRDADSSHFGKDYFEEASEFLRHELMLQGRHNLTPEEWEQENLRILLEKHQFYTEYALKNWQPVKEENIAKLMATRKKQEEKLQRDDEKARLKAKYKDQSPERGIQTFYRVALRNHIKLSDIADTKANIMLSVNAIIISLILSNLISKLDNNNYLIIPTAVFILFSAITMILAVIATRPNITRGEFTNEDIANKSVNLTFFGNFHKMKLEDFEWAIGELLKDRDYVYKSLTKDLYFLGKVLDRKYRILRITYTIFVAGTIISLFAFAAFFYMEM